MSFYFKYLKYKQKYLNLLGGSGTLTQYQIEIGAIEGMTEYNIVKEAPKTNISDKSIIQLTNLAPYYIMNLIEKFNEQGYQSLQIPEFIKQYGGVLKFCTLDDQGEIVELELNLVDLKKTSDKSSIPEEYTFTLVFKNNLTFEIKYINNTYVLEKKSINNNFYLYFKPTTTH